MAFLAEWQRICAAEISKTEESTICRAIVNLFTMVYNRGYVVEPTFEKFTEHPCLLFYNSINSESTLCHFVRGGPEKEEKMIVYYVFHCFVIIRRCTQIGQTTLEKTSYPSRAFMLLTPQV